MNRKTLLFAISMMSFVCVLTAQATIVDILESTYSYDLWEDLRYYTDSTDNYERRTRSIAGTTKHPITRQIGPTPTSYPGQSAYQEIVVSPFSIEASSDTFDGFGHAFASGTWVVDPRRDVEVSFIYGGFVFWDAFYIVVTDVTANQGLYANAYYFNLRGYVEKYFGDSWAGPLDGDLFPYDANGYVRDIGSILLKEDRVYEVQLGALAQSNDDAPYTRIAMNVQAVPDGGATWLLLGTSILAAVRIGWRAS